MSNLDLFHYKVLENKSPQTLFLLHGTGGTEDDLFPLVEPFLETHTIVGLLGNIREHGMARFFERKAEGVFNQESIKTESAKLAEFIKAWETTDNIFIGYSNGANIILATMFYYPEVIQKAALFHPMLPFEPSTDLDLSGSNILLSWSSVDPIVPIEQSKKVISTLQNYSAKVQTVETSAGHSITPEEVKALHTFINNEV